MSAMGRRLAASSGPTAEATLLSLCRISWTALSLQQQVDRHPSGRDSTDGMHWPGLLAWAAAALTAASVLLPVGGTRNHGQLTSAACGVVAAYFKYNSRLGADAVAGAQAHLPGALCVVLHTANWLAMPGERPWLFAVFAVQLLFILALGASPHAKIVLRWAAMSLPAPQG